MSTQNSTNPFQSLDKSRFRASRESCAEGVRESAPPQSPAPAPDVEDENALFLAAMAGNVKPVTGTREATPETFSPDETPFKAVMETLPASRSTARDKTRTEATPKAVPTPPSRDEENAFADAMSDVAPLRSRGREVPPPAKPAPIRNAHTDAGDIFAANIAFSLEYTEEYIQGHVVDLDPVIMAKLRSGSFSHEGHVDLHGHNMEQAYASLATFLKYAYQDGKRHLLIVTGRGKNSPGGNAVIRERVQAWLTRDPFKRVVLAFCTAKPGDGGAGALYVLLRKRKKGQGKIIWDRTPSEEELLL